MSGAPGSDAAARPDTSAGPGGWVAVRVAGVEFGLPVGSVREVIRGGPVTRLPFPPPAVRGVISVRGDLLAVLDLGERLLGRPLVEAGRMVVVAHPVTGEGVALLVDAATGMLEAGAGPLEPPEAVAASLPAGWIAGVATAAPDRLVTLLELEPILNLTAAGEDA